LAATLSVAAAATRTSDEESIVPVAARASVPADTVVGPE
jgi:hypothetical protein